MTPTGEVEIIDDIEFEEFGTGGFSAKDLLILGDDEDDIIESGIGHDKIEGGGSNDIIMSGGGSDSDTFGFYGAGHFEVQDFTIGEDRLFFDSEKLGVDNLEQHFCRLSPASNRMKTACELNLSMMLPPLHLLVSIWTISRPTCLLLRSKFV